MVCGITAAADARTAPDCGADAVGVIFAAGSPRRVDVETAGAIAAALPPYVTRVGVFVNEDPLRAATIAAEAGLDWVQFHGEETPEECGRCSLPWYKAFRAGEGFDPAALAAYPAPLHLLDAQHPSLRGGTGRTADWDAAALAARRCPVVLSGGLGPENVVAAVRRVRPLAVDVNSGVESAPGRKDPALLAALFDRLRGVGLR